MITNFDVETKNRLVLAAYRIESNILDREVIEEEAKLLAELLEERIENFQAELDEYIEHELELRKEYVERKNIKDFRLLVVILYFICKMFEDAEGYVNKGDEYFEELANGWVAPLYNGY